MKVPDIETALIQVRSAYPKAYVEGSTGRERSFWVGTDNGSQIVALAKPKGRIYELEIYDEPKEI